VNPIGIQLLTAIRTNKLILTSPSKLLTQSAATCISVLVLSILETEWHDTTFELNSNYLLSILFIVKCQMQELLHYLLQWRFSWKKVQTLTKWSVLDVEWVKFVAKKVSKTGGERTSLVLIKFALPSVQNYLWILSLMSWNSSCLSHKWPVDCRWY
jgi:hypothetical protein